MVVESGANGDTVYEKYSVDEAIKSTALCTVQPVTQECFTAETPSSSEKKEKKSKFSLRKAKVLASVVYGNLFLGCCYSLMAPFLPAEAELKGARPSVYGFIFGIYQLVMFVVSPFHGKLIGILQPGYLMKAGMLVSGVCSILFGLLRYAPAGMPFIALAFTIRIVDAIGASAFLTASYAILGFEFADVIGRAMSVVETSFCIGMAVGPVVGGFLYASGGFGLPFYVVGALLLSGTVVNFLLFAKSETKHGQQSGNARKILADFDFLLDIMTVAFCFLSVALNEATLEPHLRQFNLSAKAVGGVFLIEGIVDAVTAFLWGYIAEKLEDAQHASIVAAALMVVGFLIIGPAPFLSFPTLLWVIIVSQVLIGLAMAGEVVSGMTHGIKRTVERGFKADVSTYGMVSGLMFSGSCLAGFTGPAVGGILVDHVGYKNTTVFVIAIQGLLLLLLSARVFWKRMRRKQKGEANTEANPEKY